MRHRAESPTTPESRTMEKMFMLRAFFLMANHIRVFLAPQSPIA
jgi:hypothetical protein